MSSDFADFSTEGSFVPRRLWLGGVRLVHKKITLLEDEDVVEGQLLGKQLTATAVSAVKASGANTGTGTNVMDAAPVLANAIPGIYTLRCIEAVADGGKFVLRDPRGVSLGVYIILAGAGGVIAYANQIKGVITDAGTNFIVGDGFDITVATVEKYRACLAASVDGSQEPDAIAAYDCHADGADAELLVFTGGDFDLAGITLGTGNTHASVEEVLRRKGLILRARSVGA